MAAVTARSGADGISVPGAIDDRGDACPTCHRPLQEYPLNDPDSPQVQAALERRCDQCRAPAGQPCVKRGGFRDDLKNRLVHIGRQEKP